MQAMLVPTEERKQSLLNLKTFSKIYTNLYERIILSLENTCNLLKLQPARQSALHNIDLRCQAIDRLVDGANRLLAKWNRDLIRITDRCKISHASLLLDIGDRIPNFAEDLALAQSFLNGWCMFERFFEDEDGNLTSEMTYQQHHYYFIIELHKTVRMLEDINRVFGLYGEYQLMEPASEEAAQIVRETASTFEQYEEVDRWGDIVERWRELQFVDEEKPERLAEIKDRMRTTEAYGDYLDDTFF